MSGSAESRNHQPRGATAVDAQNDYILGFTALGIEASEMMAAVQAVMLGRLPYTVLRDAIFTHPTTAEGLVYLLANVPAKALQKAA
jgi:pyruvate/2-oxoglutarate dehydrogenase complex dihydrolipoamide dehydrogenase (E3) component